MAGIPLALWANCASAVAQARMSGFPAEAQVQLMALGRRTALARQLLRKGGHDDSW